MPGAAAFVLGVQWELHEEWQDDERSLGVWRTFVEAAAERADAREKAAVG
jgi:gamma-glutamyl-gamma-aminobutyrate hydrolase PuuD